MIFMSLTRGMAANSKMGGSDQLGNIINGMELTRRILTHEFLAHLSFADNF